MWGCFIVGALMAVVIRVIWFQATKKSNPPQEKKQ